MLSELACGGDPLFADVRKALDGNETLRKRFTELPQVLQVW